MPDRGTRMPRPHPGSDPWQSSTQNDIEPVPAVKNDQPPLPTRSPRAEIAFCCDLIDEGYDKKAWHGPNLKGSIRRVAAAEAAWRPSPPRHSIAENVVHCAYWKYAVRRRLTGEKRGSFTLKGSNWFAITSPLSEASWKEYTALLDREHLALRQTIAAFRRSGSMSFRQGGKVRFVTQIYGVALHDVYHAGQIQLLKRLHGAEGEDQDSVGRLAVRAVSASLVGSEARSFPRSAARGDRAAEASRDCGELSAGRSLTK